MSFYATISGYLTYDNDEAFYRNVKLLEEGKWINDNGYFIDECDESISQEEDDPDIDIDNRTIRIPYGFYRNLTHFFCTKTFDDKLGLLAESKGKIVWTSTDGCFGGGVIVDGEEKVYELEKWNEENNGEEAPDFEIDFDGYCDWQDEIANNFFETMDD